MIRLKHQRHPAAFHLGIAFNLADRPESCLYLVHQVAPEIQVGHFAAFEPQGELHLISVFEEVARPVDLDIQVVLADANRIDIQHFQAAALVGRTALVFLLLLLVTPLAVIHDPAHRRLGGGCNFDQVQPRFLGQFQCLRR